MAVDKSAVIMSIHPKYADAILNGDKTVEFRKQMLPETVETVWIYATKPVGLIVGRFFVSEQSRMPINHLWHEYHDRGCIRKPDFIKYFAKNTQGAAIEIAEVERFKRPLPLSHFGFKTAPQSWRYL